MTKPIRSKPSSKVSRDVDTGRFESNPYSDPKLLDQLVRVVRAVKDLEPMLSAAVLAFKQTGDERSALIASTTGVYLATLKDAALRSLAVDSESLREAKKKRLDVERLGNVPLAEQERIRSLTDEWRLDGMTPAKLLQANPQVMDSLIMLTASVAGGAHGSRRIKGGA